MTVITSAFMSPIVELSRHDQEGPNLPTAEKGDTFSQATIGQGKDEPANSVELQTCDKPFVDFGSCTNSFSEHNNGRLGPASGEVFTYNIFNHRGKNGEGKCLNCTLNDSILISNV